MTAEMQIKRTQVVNGTKKGSSYLAMQDICNNNPELVRPKTPDPHRPQGKRSWETLMYNWKVEIRSLVQNLQD